MTSGKWLVVIGGMALIAVINWYFFFAERSAPTNGASKQP